MKVSEIIALIILAILLVGAISLRTLAVFDLLIAIFNNIA